MSVYTQKIKQDALLDALVLYTRLYSKPFSHEALVSGLPLNATEGAVELFSISKPKSLFSRAASRAGLKSTLIERSLEDILSLQLPMILVLANNNSCILESFSKDKTKAKIIFVEGEGSESWVTLEELQEEYLGFGFLLKKQYEYGDKHSKTLQMEQKHWFFSTLKLSSSIYRDVLIASLLINLFVLATPLFTMNVYDRVIPNNAEETLLVFTIGVVIVYLLDLTLKFIRSYMLEIAGKKNDVILSSIIFEKVLDLKLSEHPRSVGSFASNLKDFEAVKSFFTSATITALIDLPFAIIFLAVIYYIGGIIVFVPIVSMILILMYAFLIRKPLKESIESSHVANAKKNSILIEALQNIETVKSMRMAGKVQYNWEESSGEIAHKNLKSRLLSSSIPNVTNFFIQLNTVVVIVVGVYLIGEFELTMGGLIATMILTSRAISPMGQTAALITNYSDAKSAYDVLDSIISKPVERSSSKQFLSRESFNGKIEFRDVSFAYPDSQTLALDGVSFIINPREHVGIIGKIGSGKSTIAKLILKLYEPSKGTILIDDIDISQIDPADLRRYIGYVPQDVALFSGTIKDNIIASDRHPHDEDMIEAARVSGVDDFVHSHPMGYDMPIGERGAGLSGGQRQSVGIARAILQETPTLLMDEPTNAMDQGSEDGILQRLDQKFENKTLILITQKLQMLRLCERVIVIHRGKVAIDGKKQDVLTQLGGNTNA
jgi:ATP-binding cassette subfamily C protein LapB